LFLTLSVLDILGLFVVARHNLFPAGQSTNRADIAEILAESIKTLTDIARTPQKIRRESWSEGIPSRLLSQKAAKDLRQI
jgi:hypothetical protein